MITLPTNVLVLDEAPRLTEFLSHGPLLNARDSLGWLHENKGFVGWTYSINLRLWTFLQPDKLIVDRCDKLTNSRIRKASCCHVKCYIGKKEALLGSFNLTAPTIEDLCFVISNKRLVEHLRKTFNKHWRALS